MQTLPPPRTEPMTVYLTTSSTWHHYLIKLLQLLRSPLGTVPRHWNYTHAMLRFPSRSSSSVLHLTKDAGLEVLDTIPDTVVASYTIEVDSDYIDSLLDAYVECPPTYSYRMALRLFVWDWVEFDVFKPQTCTGLVYACLGCPFDCGGKNLDEYLANHHLREY